MHSGADKPQLSIAIIGAGISSLTLARALLKHTHLTVRIYEARTLVGQHDGSGVGIAANGQKALKMIDPELLECLRWAGGVENVPTVKFLLEGKSERGVLITEVVSDPPQRTVRRSRLLEELRLLLPKEMIKTGKRLISIEQRDGRERAISLTFEDGEVVLVDAVVGADGINSFVRQHMSDDGDGSSEPKWIPGFNTRIVIPMDEAKSIFGEAYCSQSTQIGWIGQDLFCLTDVEDDGNAMQIIASFKVNEPDEETHGKAFVQVEKEFWTSKLQSRGWIGQKISQVIEGQDMVYASCFRRHDGIPLYSKGRLCLAGDAASSFSPALGAGASQAIEDALILSTVLGHASEPADLERAFKVYEDIRRPRRERVAMESNKQGAKITGQLPGVGLDLDKLAKALQEPYDYLFTYDLDRAVNEATRRMTVTNSLFDSSN